MRILLVDGHKVLKDGIKAIIESEPDLCIVGEAESGEEAILLARKLEPDLIILATDRLGPSGIDIVKRILRKSPEKKILALSMHRHPIYIRATINAGAGGYLLRENIYDEILKAIDTLSKGQSFLGEGVTC